VLAPGVELLFPPNLNVERSTDIWFAARLPYDNANRNQVSHRVIGRLEASKTRPSLTVAMRSLKVVVQSCFQGRLKYAKGREDV